MIPIQQRASIEKRRRAVKQSQCLWADKTKMEAVYLKCDLLNLFSDNRFHVDHIIPIQNDLVCGLHNEFNLQVLTLEENLSKHNNFIAGVQPKDVSNSSMFPIEKKLLEFNLVLRIFSNIDVCIEFLAFIRWGEEVKCIKCKSSNLGFIGSRKIWQCKKCRKQFSVITNTCLENSSLPVNKWIVALWLLARYPKVTGRHLVRLLGMSPRSSVSLRGVAISKDRFIRKILHELRALKLTSSGCHSRR